MAPRTIEILYLAGCPNVVLAEDRVAAAVRAAAIAASVRLVEIKTAADAQARQFRGSPTVLVDGADVDPGEGPDVGLHCRVYAGDGGRREGAPRAATIEAALRLTGTR